MLEQKVEMPVKAQQQNIWLGRLYHIADGAFDKATTAVYAVVNAGIDCFCTAYADRGPVAGALVIAAAPVAFITSVTLVGIGAVAAVGGASATAALTASLGGVGAAASLGSAGAAIGFGSSIVAAVIAGYATKKHASAVPEREQQVCNKVGGRLLLGFSLACGVGGAGVYANDNSSETQKVEPKAAATIKVSSLKQEFSLLDLRKEGCVLEFKNGEVPKVVNGTCAAKQLAL